MKIVAVISTRNEAGYITRSIRHFVDNGVQVVIVDNGSTDGTLDALRHFSSDDVLDVIHVPYPGYYHWKRVLKTKWNVVKTCGADWVFFSDVDEIPQSHIPGESLREGVERVDRLGHDVINFNEIIFVPESKEVCYLGTDYVREMDHYYFFEPGKERLMRAFRPDIEVDHLGTGAHKFPPDAINLYPQNWFNRHYLGLDFISLHLKYANRIFNPKEVKKGWHSNRVSLRNAGFTPPDPKRLKRLSATNGEFDLSAPQTSHFWEW